MQPLHHLHHAPHLHPSLTSRAAATGRRHRLAACLLALAAVSPIAQAQTVVPGVAVNMLAALRPSGDEVTSSDGNTGWPSARYPTSPPLYSVRPGTTTGYLYGGFLGAGLTGTRENLYTAVGLYSMRAGVAIYERTAYNRATDLQGRVNGTPVKAKNGSLYGVMTSLYGEQYAGTAEASNYTYSKTVGRGLVFRTDFDGTYPSIVESTRGQLYSPNGALVIDANDTLYGIDKGPKGQGRIYSINLTTGALGTLHEFPVGPKGMQQVANDLILGADGLIYGVTAYNRGLPLSPLTPTAADTPTGTLYRIDPRNPASFTVLHTFTLAEGEINVADNVTVEGFRLYPSGTPVIPGMTGDATLRSIGSGEQNGLASLVDGGDGYLYGGTSTGDCYTYAQNPSGSSLLVSRTRNSPLCGYRSWTASTFNVPFPYHDGVRPYGTLYRIAKNGSGGLQILHTFSDSDGATPRGPLALAADGAIYGTTLSGGRNTCINPVTTHAETGCGTVYRIRPSAIVVDGGGQVASGGFELVHSFSGNDGRLPLGVKAAADGRLYGVTSLGGSFANSGGTVTPTYYGTVFQVAVDSDGTPPASASLVATPSQLPAGASATLTWLTANATNCTAASSAGDWNGPVANFGSITLTRPAGTYRYTLTCNVAGAATGAQVSAATTVYVSTTPTAEDGNTVSFGNGGGGPLSPWALAPLAALAWLRRRHRQHTRTGA